MRILYSPHIPKFSYVLVVFFLKIYATSAAGNLPKNETVPAMIVFGDSIVDTGNNNYIISTIVKCNFLPYGRNFMGGKSTGRFSNGQVPADLAAQLFGVKEFIPPYLDPTLKIYDLLTGVNFASGGSGFDPLTPKLLSLREFLSSLSHRNYGRVRKSVEISKAHKGVLSLDDQLNLFEQYLSKVKALVGEKKTATILSKSIFIVCLGSDDVVNTYLTTPFRIPTYDLGNYTDLMINYASDFYKKLYKLGARRIGILSLPPLGCLPSVRTLHGGLRRDCSGKANKASLLFNSKLANLVKSLNQKHHDFRLVYLDIYTALNSILRNPIKYGFEVAKKGCCGTGLLEVSLLCNSLLNVHLCTEPSEFVFWDSYHPTEKTYRILTDMILTNETVSKFF